jgi:hypothetical protein
VTHGDETVTEGGMERMGWRGELEVLKVGCYDAAEMRAARLMTTDDDSRSG